jgi:hypothetical protein
VSTIAKLLVPGPSVGEEEEEFTSQLKMETSRPAWLFSISNTHD